MAVTNAEMIQDLFGLKTTHQINVDADTVGVSVIKILKNNPNRLSFTIFNLSGNSIYMSPSNDVSATKGIWIAPNGGSVVISWDKDFALPSNEWFAIATGAASSIFLMENIST